MPLNSKLSIGITASLTKSLDLADGSVPLAKVYQAILSSGTAAGMADLVFHDTRTLTASANEDLDLAGVLTDAFGATLTFVKVKGLFVAAAAANTNNVVVGNAATNAWATLLNSTGTIQVRPGAFVGAFAGQADAAGYAVTAGTGDLLRVTNGGAGTSVTYDIIVLGTSA